MKKKTQRDCLDIYGWWSCGGVDCGCRYCFDCHACDSCQNYDEDDPNENCELLEQGA